MLFFFFGTGDTSNMPAERWILNFDKDLSDGLVLATLLGTYCPFLVRVTCMQTGFPLFERT